MLSPKIPEKELQWELDGIEPLERAVCVPAARANFTYIFLPFFVTIGVNPSSLSLEVEPSPPAQAFEFSQYHPLQPSSI